MGKSRLRRGHYEGAEEPGGQLRIKFISADQEATVTQSKIRKLRKPGKFQLGRGQKRSPSPTWPIKMLCKFTTH